MLEVRRPQPDDLGLLDERIGVADAIAFVRRWFGVLLAGLVAGGAVGAIYAGLASPTYVAAARLLLERPRSVSPAGDPGLVQFTLDTSQIESQIQVILSESTTRRVVRELGLLSDAEFSAPRPSMLQRATGAFASLVSTSPPPKSAPPFGDLSKSAAPPEPSPARIDQVLSVINERLSARRIGQSYAIEVTFWSQDAEKAARVANSIAAAYIGNQLQLRATYAESGSEPIARKLDDLRSQVAEAQKGVRTGLIDVNVFPSADVRVITAASPPLGKSWPRTNLMIALGAIIGVMIGLLAAFALQRRRARRSTLEWN